MEVKSGIYMWTCLVSNRSYIGRSQNLERRKKEFLRFGSKHYAGKAIDRARQKYSHKSMWEYQILEKCDINELCEKERFYIEQYKTCKNGYNENFGGEGIPGYKHSEETKRKIGLFSKTYVFTDEDKLKISRSLKGHEVLNETRKKISETLKNYFKKNKNPNKGKRGKECSWCRKIGQFDKVTKQLLHIWYGTKEIERKYENFKSSTIINVCRGRKKSAYGFVWCYLDSKDGNVK